jgi:hypothetical protein
VPSPPRAPTTGSGIPRWGRPRPVEKRRSTVAEATVAIDDRKVADRIRFNATMEDVNIHAGRVETTSGESTPSRRDRTTMPCPLLLVALLWGSFVGCGSGSVAAELVAKGLLMAATEGWVQSLQDPIGEIAIGVALVDGETGTFCGRIVQTRVSWVSQRRPSTRQRSSLWSKPSSRLFPGEYQWTVAHRPPLCGRLTEGPRYRAHLWFNGVERQAVRIGGNRRRFSNTASLTKRSSHVRDLRGAAFAGCGDSNSRPTIDLLATRHCESRVPNLYCSRRSEFAQMASAAVGVAAYALHARYSSGDQHCIDAVKGAGRCLPLP